MLHSILLTGILCSTVWAGYDDVLAIHQLETETADRIQAGVVDSILGPGQATVFVKLRVEVKQEIERADRFGAGHAGRFKFKPAAVPSQGISASSSTVVHSTISFKGGSGTTTEAGGDDDLFAGFGFDAPACGHGKPAAAGGVPGSGQGMSDDFRQQLQGMCACPGNAEAGCVGTAGRPKG